MILIGSDRREGQRKGKGKREGVTMAMRYVVALQGGVSWA